MRRAAWGMVAIARRTVYIADWCSSLFIVASRVVARAVRWCDCARGRWAVVRMRDGVACSGEGRRLLCQWREAGGCCSDRPRGPSGTLAGDAENARQSGDAGWPGLGLESPLGHAPL